MKIPRQISRDESLEAGPPAAWDGEGDSFGSWLRRQREVREIDLREIADQSKISMTYLKAFEQERFDLLPAPVFAKGFLRQYARYVGLDAEEVVNFYESARRWHEGGEDEDEAELEAPRLGAWKLGALALGAALIVALLLWALTRAPSDGGAQTAAPAAPEAGHPTAVAAPEEEPAAAGPLAAEGGGEPEPQPAAPLRMILDFSGACWVEASVDGVRQVAENKVQGESLVLEAKTLVELKIGNVDVVEIEINGHPFEFDEVPGSKVRGGRFDLETVAALTGARNRGDTP